MMEKLKYPIFYFLFSFLMVFLFMHTLFPGKRVVPYISNYLSSKYRIDFRCRDLHLKFPLTVAASGISLSGQGSPPVRIDEIYLRPDFLSFFTGKIGFFVKTGIFSGRADGDMKFSIFHPEKNFQAELNFSDIDLSGFNVISGSGVNISGSISGKAKADMKNGKGDIRFFSRFSNLSVQSSSFFIPPLSSFKIEEIGINGKIENKNLILEKSVLKSKAGVSEINGKITNIYNPLYAFLDIKGKVVPNTGYLSKNRQDPAIGMAFSFLKGKKALNYSISGNMRNPNFRMNN